MMRKLYLIFFITLLLAPMNACMIANYHITAQESSEKKAIVASKGDEAVQFVIPRYYRVETRCQSRGRDWVGLIGGLAFPSCREYRDVIGTQMHDGVLMALNDMPLGKPVEFIEYIRSQGLVCVVTLNEQINDDIPYSEILSLATLFTVPVYTTHKYVLSYYLLFDSKTVKKYEYYITQKALWGWISWVLSPVMYPFWDDIKMEIMRDYGEYGPHASVVSETTKRFLSEGHRDGIL